MFSNEQLHHMVQQHIISEQYPYSEKDDRTLHHYLKPLLAELSRATIRYVVERDHFGSGYASYIKVFCYEDAFVNIEENQWTQHKQMEGLQVLISRLAPVIVIGPGSESVTYHHGKQCGGSAVMLDGPDNLYIEPQFEALQHYLIRLFMKYHFTVLHREELAEPFAYDGTIPTLSRSKGKYLVWDAVFYWED